MLICSCSTVNRIQYVSVYVRKKHSKLIISEIVSSIRDHVTWCKYLYLRLHIFFSLLHIIMRGCWFCFVLLDVLTVRSCKFFLFSTELLSTCRLVFHKKFKCFFFVFYFFFSFNRLMNRNYKMFVEQKKLKTFRVLAKKSFSLWKNWIFHEATRIYF